MPTRSCRTCGRPASARYCDACQPAARPNFRERGYGAEFERNRKRLLALRPYCVDCGQAANVADHIIEKVDGGSDDLSNLEPRCSMCHSKKTARTRPGGWHSRTRS